MMKLKYIYMTVAIILFFALVLIFAQNIAQFQGGVTPLYLWPFKSVGWFQGYWWIVILSMGLGISILLMIQKFLASDNEQNDGFGI